MWGGWARTVTGCGVWGGQDCDRVLGVGGPGWLLCLESPWLPPQSPPLEDQRKKRLGLKEQQLIAKYSAITRIGSQLQLGIHGCIMDKLSQNIF